MAGPQLNYLLSATQKYLRNDMVDDRIVPGTLEEVGKETITDRYNSIDIIGRIDLGVDIQLASNLFLNAGMSMGYGFTDINASDWHYPDSDDNYNPSHNVYGGLNVGINYTLPIGSK
jgi:asparagine synthetase A